MKQFKLRVSSFSICWLRAYDFGLDKQALEHVIARMKDGSLVNPLVNQVRRVAISDEIDEIDKRMFDIRYQERSELVRIRLQPCKLIRQRLGSDRTLSARLTVNLLLDTGSGFGVFNITVHPFNRKKSIPFNIEEIVFLSRQWMLVENEDGKPIQLNILLPERKKKISLYIREIMNFYYLRLHQTLWEAAKPGHYSLLPDPKDFQGWADVIRETDPTGCTVLHELQKGGFIRTLFPTSFGPVLDIWKMEGIAPEQFDADAFSREYLDEISMFLTDGQRTTLGASIRNQRQASILALYIWPNHALYINQSPKAISDHRVRSRVRQYGCLDVEIVRILEILNLQSALNHAFDSILDRHLEEVDLLAAKEPQALVEITEQRRNISRSMRSFDFYNLFHTAYWESLYARLLENPYLRFRDTVDLIEKKTARLDEEIQQAIIIQDRARHQQQRKQELDVLRGLHRLSLSNDIQNSALMTINFIVSATASFAFMEVVEPLLTQIYGIAGSFKEVYPLPWLGLNLGTFLILALILWTTSSFLIRNKGRGIELDGQLDLPYDPVQLVCYLARHKDLDYHYLDSRDRSGYLRILLPHGSLSLEFDQSRFTRFILFLQGEKNYDEENLKKIYVDGQLDKLLEKRIIRRSNR